MNVQPFAALLAVALVVVAAPGLASAAAVAAAADPCGGTFGSNVYNLMPFVNSGTGYVADAGVYRYTVGVCETLSDSPCSANGGGDDVQVCQAWPPFNDDDSMYLGKTVPVPTYAEVAPGQGVVLNITGGASSKSCGKDNSVLATCACDPTAKGAPVFAVEEAVDCVTTFSVSHSWCCPVAPPTPCDNVRMAWTVAPSSVSLVFTSPACSINDGTAVVTFSASVNVTAISGTGCAWDAFNTTAVCQVAGESEIFTFAIADGASGKATADLYAVNLGPGSQTSSTTTIGA